MDIIPFFKLMVDRNASDLFFSVGAPPNMKIEGVTAPIGKAALKSQQVVEIAKSIMSDTQQKEFDETMELIWHFRWRALAGIASISSDNAVK